MRLALSSRMPKQYAPYSTTATQAHRLSTTIRFDLPARAANRSITMMKPVSSHCHVSGIMEYTRLTDFPIFAQVFFICVHSHLRGVRSISRKSQNTAAALGSFRSSQPQPEKQPLTHFTSKSKHRQQTLLRHQ